MLTKVINKLVFSNKRSRKIITPCCGKHNKDGKFVNYKNYPNNYGFCHSCGESSLPPNLYTNENGERFVWNTVVKKFEPFSTTIIAENLESIQTTPIDLKFIDENIIWRYYLNCPENNLLQYFRKTYGNIKTDEAKEMYVLGTSKDGGITFWTINKNLQVQKLKIAYYNDLGKRTNNFKVPYLKKDGYLDCLFGEHLLVDKYKKSQVVVLVESEKSAVVCSMLMNKYTWLAYGGLNGLTNAKIEVLRGFEKVLIIPDFSSNANNVINKKIKRAGEIGIYIKYWKFTGDLSDSNLKNMKIYNDDLEDVLRYHNSEVYQNIIQKPP